MDYKQFVLEVEALMLSMNPFVFSWPFTPSAKHSTKYLLSSLDLFQKCSDEVQRSFNRNSSIKTFKYALTFISKQARKLLRRK